jgi:nucleoside-diphosphate-sugar epimerase
LVLITGGTGFIGSHLAERLIAKGQQVRVLAKLNTSREQDNAMLLRKAGAEVIVGGVEDASLMKQAMEGVTRVFHIAAAMREANVPDALFWKINVQATEKLLQASLGSGVNRFVYCSTVGVMGRPERLPADEDIVCQPNDIYQRTKYEAEKVVLRYHREHDMPVVIIRPPEVYGPRDFRLLKLFRGIKNGRFLMIGDGKGKHHLLFIDDLIDGMELAAEKREATGQVFILADESAIELNEFVKLIARQLEVSIPRARIPYAPVYLLAMMVEFLCRPLRIQPPLYRRRVKFFKHNYWFDITKARQTIGFNPRIGLPAGISRTIRWYTEAGLL